MIEIRNGCKYVGLDPAGNSWVYENAVSTGITRVFFVAPASVIPKIGDFINEDTFTWVARTEYKIVPNQENKYLGDDDYEFRR